MRARALHGLSTVLLLCLSVGDLAAFYGNRPAVEYLLEAGIGVRDDTGVFAAAGQTLDVALLAFLLEKGADVNKPQCPSMADCSFRGAPEKRLASAWG